MSYNFSVGDLSPTVRGIWSDKLDAYTDDKGSEELTSSELASIEIAAIKEYLSNGEHLKSINLANDLISIDILLNSIHCALDL